MQNDLTGNSISLLKPDILNGPSSHSAMLDTQCIFSRWQLLAYVVPMSFLLRPPHNPQLLAQGWQWLLVITWQRGLGAVTNFSPALGKLRPEHCYKSKSSLGPETQLEDSAQCLFPLFLDAGIWVSSLTKHVAIVFVADSCIYKKVCPFNGGSFLLQPSASDFQFCWNQAPYAIGKEKLFCGSLPLANHHRAWSPVGN